MNSRKRDGCGIAVKSRKATRLILGAAWPCRARYPVQGDDFFFILRSPLKPNATVRGAHEVKSTVATAMPVGIGYACEQICPSSRNNRFKPISETGLVHHPFSHLGVQGLGKFLGALL